MRIQPKIIEIHNGELAEDKGNIMQNFTLVGKARTVFRLIELKAQREKADKKSHKRSRNKRK